MDNRITIAGRKQVSLQTEEKETGKAWPFIFALWPPWAGPRDRGVALPEAPARSSCRSGGSCRLGSPCPAWPGVGGAALLRHVHFRSQNPLLRGSCRAKQPQQSQLEVGRAGK